PKDKKLVPLLVQILKDKDQQVLHFAAARSLGFLGADAREAIPDLIDALKADDFTNAAQRSAILRNILSTLEQFGADAKEAVPIIRVLANDADRGVRDSARRALKKLDPVP
ncbi:MAG TPA: HEAT repeat domain-containing protein, partial [Gemmataceae bacterium]|nr:HEAT repeat domain-containing protein [Gemmataceae bacterium]